jgi:hypothetical protein
MGFVVLRGAGHIGGGLLKGHFYYGNRGYQWLRMGKQAQRILLLRKGGWMISHLHLGFGV